MSGARRPSSMPHPMPRPTRARRTSRPSRSRGPLVPIADGDKVFGLRIVATPGHTQGHVSVLDEAGGVLVAGDALATTRGKPTPPNPGFTADVDEAMASIARLGSMAFETLLVGHGEPIESGAAGLVKALAAG